MSAAQVGRRGKGSARADGVFCLCSSSSCPATTTASSPLRQRLGEAVGSPWRSKEQPASNAKPLSLDHRSPSLPLSRSSSYESQDSACTPLTSLDECVEENNLRGGLSSDCDYGDMTDIEAGPSRLSPLAYKRKGSVLPLEGHSVKRSRRDGQSPSRLGRRSSQQLVPEVVINQRSVSPWSKQTKPTEAAPPVPARRQIIEAIDLCDSTEDEDDDIDDDDIVLLYTKKSTSEYADSSSVCRSSSVCESSPVSGSITGLPHSSPSTSRTPHRSAMEKLSSFIEDLFEAETDSTGSDGAASAHLMSSLARSFFTVQDGTPLLRLAKVTRLIRLVHACPTKRSVATGREEADAQVLLRWNDMDHQELSRLMKIMHRGLDSATILDPFPLLTTERKRVSPVKKKRARKQETGEDDAPMLTEEALEDMRSKLSRIAYSVTVADGCLSILTKKGTNKVLLCEEMVLPCLQSLKAALDNVIIPFAEACSEASSCCNLLLEELVGALGTTEASCKDNSPSPSPRSASVAACAQQLASIYSCVVSSLPRLQVLLKRSDLILSETMAFVLANSLLPAFFILDPEASATHSSSSSGKEAIKVAALASLSGGQTPMKSLRLSAIHVLRLTYERSEEQKDYIITTILDSMQSLQDTKKQARRQHGLANGKAICSSTALLLQIIQASSQSVAIAKKEEEEWVDGETPDETIVQSDVFRLDALREGQDKARKAAKDVAQCLMHKVEGAGVAKTTKNAAPVQTGFATVIESLVSDLLDTLCCPEWPASSMLLSQLCVHFCTYLEEERGTHEVRGIALDQLGLMAKSWYESKLQSHTSEPVLANVYAILEARDAMAMEQLNRAYWAVIESLKQRKDEEGSMEGAARFLEAQWGREMMLLLYKGSDAADTLMDARGAGDEVNVLSSFIRRVDTLVGQVVQAADKPDELRTMFEIGDEAAPLSITDTFQKLMHSFAFGARFDAIEGQLLSASNGPNAANRNKALRGLSHISEINGDFLLREDVRAAVQRCMYDESVNVRDTAVGLMGKFALSHCEHLESMLPSLKEKMEDTALLIRKRTLRLFREVYDTTLKESIQVEAAVEIVRSVFDEEETMRDLAVESAAQMWFGMSSSAIGRSQGSKTPKARSASKQLEDGQDRDGHDGQTEAAREKIQSRLCNIVQVANRLRLKPSPVQEVLQMIVKKRDGDELQRQMAQLVHLTIDNIVESQQSTQETVAAEQLVEQVEVIAMLVQTSPSTLSIRKAKLLLPYLRGGSREAEIRLLRSLLAIFNSCLPIMASTGLSFAKQLQSTLTPLVNRPSSHIAVIEELVKCYCTVIRSQTHDMGILIKTMQLCHRQVKKYQVQEPVNDAEIRNAKVLIVMVSLLAENADYDAIRMEYPTFAQEVDQITIESVSEEVAATLTSLLQVAPLRVCALQSLRFVCRAFPKLVMRETLGELIESIFKDGSAHDRLVVLRIIADILEVDSAKYDPDQVTHGRDKKKDLPKEVAREELAGESESQGSPVTFEIVGRYGDLVQALAVYEPLQKMTLEIIEVIVLRGICHPLQYLSTIISLQSVTKDKWISNKAQSLHRHLINKSGTSINFRQALHAREAWQFQQTRNGLEVSGCNEQQEALFETWYNSIKEQKKTRLDLLKALTKAFDVNISTGVCSQEDVHYARFVAENLAALNYKTIEEVLLVASEVQHILTVAGEQVQISVQEEIPVDGEEDEEDDEMDDEGSQRAIVIGRMSTIMSIALRLLAHLREQYGLKEAQIAKGVDKKASNVAAVRKGSSSNVVVLHDLPGAYHRHESLSLAKREMNVFDSMLNNEGIGADRDDYDMDD